MKYTAIEKELPAHELEADFERAQKIEKWRIGEKALFQTNGLFSIKYLPFSSIIKAYPHDFQIKGGCSCAGTYPSSPGFPTWIQRSRSAIGMRQERSINDIWINDLKCYRIIKKNYG